MVNAKRSLHTPEGHFVLYAGHSSNIGALVTDIVTDVLIRFSVIAQRSKGVHYFHGVCFAIVVLEVIVT